MLVALAVCFVGAQSAAGQDDAKLRNAMNNAQEEMIQCAAYFNMVAVSNKPASTINGYRQQSGLLLEKSIRLSEFTGITVDAMKSRFEMANKDDMTLLRSSCVNISSLLSR